MRQHIIVIALLSFLAGLLLVGRRIFRPDPSAYAGYAFDSLFLICTIVALVWLMNLIYLRLAKSQSTPQLNRSDRPPNQRQSYRVIYPYQYRPDLVIDKTDHHDRRSLTFAVLDLSQDGVRFKDDGSLGAATRLSGRIKIQDGHPLPVSGTIVRLDGNQVCVQFLRSLPWSTLLEEQRRLLHIFQSGKT